MTGLLRWLGRRAHGHLVLFLIATPWVWLYLWVEHNFPAWGEWAKASATVGTGVMIGHYHIRTGRWPW